MHYIVHFYFLYAKKRLKIYSKWCQWFYLGDEIISDLKFSSLYFYIYNFYHYIYKYYFHN